MECYRGFGLCPGFEFSFVHEAFKKFRMVKHFKMPTKLRVFVLKCVKAMRTRGHHRLNLVAFECGNILFGHALKQELVPEPACNIPSTLLLTSENSELNSCFLQQLGQCAHNLLVPLDKRSAAA